MTSYFVRPATLRDGKAVQDLARRVRRELRLGVRSPGVDEDDQPARMWVVEAGRGEIVGSCGVRDAGGGIWELTTLYLSPEWRGLGLGRSLVELALRAVLAEGGLEVHLGVATECVQAVNLAIGLGFHEAEADADGQRSFVLTLAKAS